MGIFLFVDGLGQFKVSGIIALLVSYLLVTFTLILTLIFGEQLCPVIEMPLNHQQCVQTELNVTFTGLAGLGSQLRMFPGQY